jgi:hypothetical protein
MLLGHLKAEDFTNLMEGTALADKQRRHLESCARCSETLNAVQVVRSQVTEMQMEADEHIPEPDWSEFRGDVRNALLSRSVQRETTKQNWFGMGWKPVAAWGFSLLLVLGLASSVRYWNQTVGKESIIAETPRVDTPAATTPTEISTMADMSKPDVFNDLLNLNEHEAAALVMILDEMTPTAPDGARSQ